MVGSEPSCVCARSVPAYTYIACPDNHAETTYGYADGSAAHGYAKTADCDTDQGPTQPHGHAEAADASTPCPGHLDRERAAVSHTPANGHPPSHGHAPADGYASPRRGQCDG